MWHRIIEHVDDIKPRKIERKKIMAPNPHYVNMVINFSILGTLIYVAIQVS
jgi:hypothetical protein